MLRFISCVWFMRWRSNWITQIDWNDFIVVLHNGTVQALDKICCPQNKLHISFHCQYLSTFLHIFVNFNVVRKNGMGLFTYNFPVHISSIRRNFLWIFDKVIYRMFAPNSFEGIWEEHSVNCFPVNRDEEKKNHPSFTRSWFPRNLLIQF